MARRELLSLSLYSLLASNRGGLFIVFLPLYLVEVKGASLPVALTFLSLAYVPSSLIGPWIGRLSDQAGRRRPFLLLGEAGAFPLFLAIVFAPGYLLAGALFVAAELALAIGSPAYNAYVADVTRENERGEGYGLLNATSNGGAVAGFVLAGLVTYWYGLGALFPFVVAVMVGTLSVVVFLVPDVRRESPVPRRRSWGEMKPVVIFSLAVSVRAIGSGAVATFYGYLAASLGANSLEVSLVAVAGLVTAAVVSLPFGRWIDRTGEIRAIWYGTALALASYGIFMISSNWFEVVPGRSSRRVPGGLCPDQLDPLEHRTPRRGRCDPRRGLPRPLRDGHRHDRRLAGGDGIFVWGDGDPVAPPSSRSAGSTPFGTPRVSTLL